MSILVLDPNSKQLYRYHFESNTHQALPTYSEQASHDIENELKDLDKLVNLDSTGWTFSSKQSINYRLSLIPRTLIHPSACPYPSFTTFRELSSAFASVTSLRLYIDISRYLASDSFHSFTGNSNSMARESFSFKRAEKLIELKVTLVSTVKETIKYMLDQVESAYGLTILPLNPNNQFTFKVRGRKEYFTGNYPMLVYRSVRNSLRGMDYLSVNLTEVPADLDMPHTVYFDEKEKTSHLFNFYMFYLTPFTNLPKVVNERKVSNLRSCLLNEAGEVQSLTGENDWPFRVRVSGLENLFNLFAEAFLGTAADNGTEKPRYLVKPSTDKVRENEVNVKKRLSSSGSSHRESVPFLRAKQKLNENNTLEKQISRTPYINHSDACISAKLLADEFKLPFTPYVVRIDVKVLYGESVLKDCYLKTKYSPFNYSARFSDWLYFPVKVSEIPKESRVALNVLLLSQLGESMIVGSCTRPLFDEARNFLTGAVEVNLWPFYRVEESLACMQEFNGICTDYMTKSYAKIYLNFDDYLTPSVKWSPKDYSYIKNMYNSFSSIPKKQGFRVKLHQKLNESDPVYLRYSNPHAKTRRTAQIFDTSTVFSGNIGDDPEEEAEKDYIKLRPKIEELAALEKVLLKDPLEELSLYEQRLLFICRDHYRSIPIALLLFLKSIDWTRPLQIKEAYKYMALWTPMQPEDSLALLMAEYPDEAVRAYAVQKVEELSDEDFHLYMLQLIQAVTFENFHSNSLSEVILNRALRNPHQVGHYLFWTLRSQLHVKSKVERLGLMLERFIMLCTNYREDLAKQVNFLNFYSEQSGKLSEKDSYQDREKQLKSLIEQNCDRAQNLCTVPVDSSIEVSGPLPGKCKVMDSKKMPLWLTLLNSESGAEMIPIIFKTGDDLRQDILSLQLIRVMDMIWLENGLDLRMKPYQVIATGDQNGIIEAVKNAETTAKIHRDYGGTLGALKNATFKDYLNEHNPSLALIEKALDNFIRSSAGYCVATYVLGIGDRHNGNIMITRTGHLFHIDFGHFLGNFKTALGIQRERSKFVLTEEMVFAMGGKESDGFKLFKEYCCKAYNYIRNHGKRFINLFLFMVTAGMPELTKKKEIEYLREMLSLKLTEMEAESKFLEEIENSLNNTFRRFDNLMHNFKH